MKTLYCVAYNEYNFATKTWEAKELFMHAEDQANARWAFVSGLPRHRQLGRNVQIVGVAPAIGGFAQDDHADNVLI